MLEMDGIGEVIGHDAAMRLAISVGTPVVPMAELHKKIAAAVKKEAEELDKWFAEEAVPPKEIGASLED